jgi:hypothetical protein
MASLCALGPHAEACAADAKAMPHFVPTLDRKQEQMLVVGLGSKSSVLSRELL